VIGDKKVPYFIKKNLITKEYILKLLNEHLGSGSIFVTGVKVSRDNHINVFLDCDTNLTIADCVAVSRFLEKKLDSEKNDFSLDVSSHGATTPLVMPRQYSKHIGRNFEIKLVDDTKLTGTLTEFNSNELKLEYTEREDKAIGKGKITITKQHIIPHNQIKESKIKLKF
jgi:ribosome maturation factor RimP